MKKKILIGITVLIVLYIFLCLFMYIFQEKFIFTSRKLNDDFKFNNGIKYEEIYLNSSDGTKIHGALFKSDSAKGLMFFLHGSGGNISWYEKNIPVYVGLNYDMFLLDYRGYGKSSGKITKEEQPFMDALSAYELMMEKYSEDEIVIIGSSLGTIFAASIAAEYSPKALIIEGTPYDTEQKGKKKYPFLPVSLLSRYRFSIEKYIPKIQAPITVFHGDQDDHCDINNLLLLKPMLKPNDKIIILEGEGHHNFSGNVIYV